MRVASWGLAFRRAGPEDRSLALVLAAGAGCSLLLARFLPLIVPLVPPCPFHALTGLPCPGCGSTRALVALAQGDLLRAIGWNPLAAAVFVGGWFACLVLPLWVVLRQPLPQLAPVLPWKARGTMIALLAANWAYLVARGV